MPQFLIQRFLSAIFPAVCVVVAAPLMACQPLAQPEPAEVLPVRAVVLFNSGAAQFTHATTVTGTTALLMPVPVAKTNDLLKSLVFDDRSGGRVSGVRYQTSRDQIDEAADALRQPLTLAQFLQSQRGQQIEHGVGNELLTGRILGVEERIHGEESVETLVVVSAEGAIHSRPVRELEGIRFADPQVAEKLANGLTGLARDDSSAVNQIEMEFAGEGEREVRFSYIVDAPVWKMSWRLAIDGDKAALQGWAHVDNDTGLDWNSVQLELRSGRPFLFSAAVFEPIATRRPDLGISVFEIPKDSPVVRLSGFTPNLSLKVSNSQELQSSGGGGFGGGGIGGGAFGGNHPESDPSQGITDSDFEQLTELINQTVDPDSAFQEVARAAITSQTIVLNVTTPVSVAAGQSAMVPVFRGEANHRQKTVLSISLEDFESEAPLRPTRAYELNGIDTAQLIAGPVAVFREGVFTGDCVLRRPVAGQPLLLEFGRNVDLLVNDRAMKQAAAVVSAKRSNGKNLVTRKITRTIQMTIRNVGKESCRLDLEIRGVDGWTLVGSALKLEGNSLLGDLQIESGLLIDQQIVLVREEVSEASVSGVSSQWNQSNGAMELDDGLRAMVIEFNELSANVGRLLTETSSFESALQSQLKEQARLTSQLAAAGNTTELGQVLADRILAGEQTITELRNRISGLTAERRALEAQRAALEAK